jgi:hypothetical protein
MMGAVPARVRGKSAPAADFAVTGVAVGPAARLVSSGMVSSGEGAVVLEAYTPDGRRTLMRVDPDEVWPISGFRSGATGVRAGTRLSGGDLLLVGDSAAYRVDLEQRRAERLVIRRLPRNISHVCALDDETLLVAPLFADTVALISLAEGSVVHQFRGAAHDVVRRDGDSLWLVNGARGTAVRHRRDDLEVVARAALTPGATPIDDGREVFSLPGAPYQTGGISRASFVQIRPDGRVQASSIDGDHRREGEGAAGLDQLVGIDAFGRLVGLAGSAVVLLDRTTLSPLARLPLVVRRLLGATMVGPTTLALLQPLPPLVHFVSW